MALTHVVTGTVTSSEVVLIKDSAKLPSLAITSHVLSLWNDLQSVNRIIIVALEKPVSSYKRLALAIGGTKFQILDGISDPAGWLGLEEENKNEALVVTKLTQLDHLKKFIFSFGTESKPTVVFIDSLNALTNHKHASAAIAAFISDLKYCPSSTVSSIVMSLHTDLCNGISSFTHPSSLSSNRPTKICVADLESVSSCIIETLPLPNNGFVDVNGTFSILQKRKSGKVSRLVEHYTFNPAFFRSNLSMPPSLSFILYADSQVVKKESTPIAENKFKSMMDQLTPEQEAARASVNLPHTRAKDFASQSISGLPEISLDHGVHVTGDKGTVVFLEPDDDSFGDDYDPYEDLDI